MPQATPQTKNTWTCVHVRTYAVLRLGNITGASGRHHVHPGRGRRAARSPRPGSRGVCGNQGGEVHRPAQRRPIHRADTSTGGSTSSLTPLRVPHRDSRTHTHFRGPPQTWWCTQGRDAGPGSFSGQNVRRHGGGDPRGRPRRCGSCARAVASV